MGDTSQNDKMFASFVASILFGLVAVIILGAYVFLSQSETPQASPAIPIVPTASIGS